MIEKKLKQKAELIQNVTNPTFYANDSAIFNEQHNEKLCRFPAFCFLQIISNVKFRLSKNHVGRTLQEIVNKKRATVAFCT